MYEQIRNELANKLLNEFKQNEVQKILRIVDAWANDYYICAKTTAIVPYQDTIQHIVELFIASKSVEGQSGGTALNRKLLLGNFTKYIHKPLQDIEANDLRAFLYAYKENTGVSDRTLDSYRIILSSFFTWCFEEEYIKSNPARKVKPIHYEKKEREYLTRLELEQLLNSCICIREKALIEFLFSTGCRVSELCEIQKSDIDFREQSVKLFDKGKKHRTSYINARTLIYLEEYLNSRTDDSPYLFVTSRKPYGKLKRGSVERIVRNIAKRSGIQKPVSPHILRHTTATIALESGMKIEEIQRLLGHENVQTTLVYASINNDHIKSEHRRCVA